MRELLAAALLTLPLVAAEHDGSFERSLNVSGPVDLEVQTNSGSIYVRTGSASTVQIRGAIRVNRRWDRGDVSRLIRDVESNPPIQQSGNTIRIGPLRDEEFRRHLSIRYDLVVPEQTKLRARTGSGRIEVEAIHGPVDAQTGSGSIDGRGISGSIVARTGSGGVRLEQTAAAPIEVRTGSGSVHLRLPSSGGYDLHARTGSGRVHVEQPVTVSGTINRHSMHGKLRGGGTLLDVSTGSGGIRIE